MQLGWIDFSKEERNKVLNVIHLLDEPGAVDELGLGSIRDAFADKFFPGTSTVQTRAKYFLIVPYVLKEAGLGQFGSDVNNILRSIDKEERECRDILLRTSSDGVIGSLRPNSWVLRTPLNIYWNGIKRLGIFTKDLTVKEYIHQSVLQRTLKDSKAYRNREKEAEENEKDDYDAGDITSLQFWNLGDTYDENWRKTLTIELLPTEAAFLKSQIITNARDSLFSFIMQNSIDLEPYDSFGAFSLAHIDKVDPEMAELIKLANDFNDLVSMITTRYNLIVSQYGNHRAVERWDMLSENLQGRAAVDLKSIFNKLMIKKNGTMLFLLQIKDAFISKDIDKADDLIIRREKNLKGSSRAKTMHPGEYPDHDWIGFYKLDYRYSPSKRIIKDILSVEGI